jgi:iron complex outermembrane receptor protein
MASGLDGDTFKSFFGSVGYRDITVAGGYIRREKGDPTAQQFTTFNDSRLRTIDDRYYVDLKYTHELPAGIQVNTRAYYDGADYKIGYPVGTPVATAFYQEAQAGEWWGAELQLSKKVWDKHTITLGAEFRDDFHQSQHIFDTTTTFTDNHASRQSHGVYLQGEFEVLTNLHVNAGVRYDQYGDFDPSYNPRLAVIYSPFEQSTIKLLGGKAFRAPNFLELSDPRFQNLQPEEITSYELVYEQGIGRYLRSSISGFDNRLHDLIVFRNGSFANVNAETVGTELALEANWSGGLRGRASYTLQSTQNRSADWQFADSPEQLVKFNVSVPLFQDKFFAGLEYQYTSSRHTFFTTTGGTTVVGGDAAGFGVLNATLFSQHFFKNLEFSASVYNLLDQTYSDPATGIHAQDKIPQDGRSFQVKVTCRF